MDLDLSLIILFALASAAGLAACIIGCIWLCPWLSTYFAKLRQYRALCNDLAYPYFVRSFDVSRKRNPLMEDYIDQFLIDGGYIQILQHDRYLLEWKAQCRQRIEGSPDWLKDRANQLFYANLDDAHAYQFYLRRNQTRYRQVNYRKIPYTVSQEAEHFFCDLPYLENRNMKLKEIGYECTLHDYFVKDQRRLMTKDLRKQIMIRDHYTCQYCGKYMPDEVGLTIDHIRPVSKGGKTVPSNLQVLCSKCNGRKSNK